MAYSKFEQPHATKPFKRLFAHCHKTTSIAIRLSWWESGSINKLVCILDRLVLWLEEWGAGEGHETGARGLEDAEGGDELHEGVDAGWLSRAVLRNQYYYKRWW